MVLVSLGYYAIFIVILGAALWPALWLITTVWQATIAAAAHWHLLALGLSISAGYFCFGAALCLATVAVRHACGLHLKEGAYSYTSVKAIQWAFLSALVLVVRICFMEFLRLTPFLNWYYRGMGARIGRGVQINSIFVNDAPLIEIGDNTLIGGDVVMIAHAAERGKLKLRATRIGRNVTIGLNSVILPGVDIGDGAVVGAMSVVLKGAHIPPKAVWMGNPARPIREQGVLDEMIRGVMEKHAHRPPEPAPPQGPPAAQETPPS